MSYDKQIRRYAKALTAEVEARTELAEYKAWAEALENRELVKILNADPKLAEWKARAHTKSVLVESNTYRYANHPHTRGEDESYAGLIDLPASCFTVSSSDDNSAGNPPPFTG